ncbi:hypothetical protein ACQ4PT_026589 [Festuca glaucescens]
MRGQHGTATATATPRILNLSRRSSAGGRPSRGAGRAQQPRPAPRPVANLGALFEMERRVRGLESAPASPPRSRAARPPPQERDAGEQEDKWRFQAEILRAECNFLRMEREVALRKLDCHRGQMEAALKTAVETLASGRKKIDGRGEAGVAAALDEGIEDLEGMMEELRVDKESGRRAMSGCGARELRRSHGRNFDRQASSLRRRLEKMPSADAEHAVCKDICEIARPAVPTPPRPAEHSNRDDHGPSANLSDSVAEEPMGSGSCCDCKEIVGRIMKQVRAESEQWTEMQEMLEQVRLEMQELQSSRDTWQRRAIASDISLSSLNSQMLEWKQRTQASEHHAEELQKKVTELQGKLHTFKSHFPAPSLPNRAWSEACKMENPRGAKAQQHHRPPQDGGKEKEKHVLICRVKHSPSVIPRRSPLQEIGNISLPRQWQR